MRKLITVIFSLFISIYALASSLCQGISYQPEISSSLPKLSATILHLVVHPTTFWDTTCSSQPGLTHAIEQSLTTNIPVVILVDGSHGKIGDFLIGQSPKYSYVLSLGGEVTFTPLTGLTSLILSGGYFELCLKNSLRAAVSTSNIQSIVLDEHSIFMGNQFSKIPVTLTNWLDGAKSNLDLLKYYFEHNAFRDLPPREIVISVRGKSFIELNPGTGNRLNIYIQPAYQYPLTLNL